MIKVPFLKKIRKLKMNKAVHDTDIPVRILKENAEYFAEYICFQFNEAICASKFFKSASFKFANITPVFNDNLPRKTLNIKHFSLRLAIQNEIKV